MYYFQRQRRKMDKQNALSLATIVLDVVAIGLATTAIISNAVIADAETAMILVETSDEEPTEEETVTTTTYTGTLSIIEEEEEPEEVAEDNGVYREEMLEESLLLEAADPYPEDWPLERDYITIYTDLHVDKCPSVETLDKILEWWNPRIGSGEGTRYLGHGDAFHEAWERTGMDPLIIMGIAAWEGGWGNSRVALAKNNFYGIGVYDSDPLYWASRMADGEGEDAVHEGIVNGAVGIYENYYLKGNTNLALINNNGYNGYNGGTYWAETITEQMINVHYRVCKEILKEDD